jgi:hypothetical protein
MIIKDLEISKELSRKELCGVRGGFNFANVGGQAIVTAGGSVLSPLTASNSPIVAQSEVHPVTTVDLNTANVIGSLGTLLFQV